MFANKKCSECGITKSDSLGSVRITGKYVCDNCWGVAPEEFSLPPKKEGPIRMENDISYLENIYVNGRKVSDEEVETFRRSVQRVVSEYKKPRPSLLPPVAVTEVAHVLTFGDSKHPDQKWKKMEPDDHVDAALRHVFAHMSGETSDTESGRLHLAHAATRLLFAVELLKTK